MRSRACTTFFLLNVQCFLLMCLFTNQSVLRNKLSVLVWGEGVCVSPYTVFAVRRLKQFFPGSKMSNVLPEHGDFSSLCFNTMGNSWAIMNKKHWYMLS